MRSTYDETRSPGWKPLGTHREMYRRYAPASEPPECEGKVFETLGRIWHPDSPNLARVVTVGQCARCANLIGIAQRRLYFDTPITTPTLQPVPDPE